MKIIKWMLKNIVLSTIFIYALDLILVKINFIIPLNFFSIGITSILGTPGLLAYIILLIKFCG